MLITQPAHKAVRRSGPARVGLALAGGGPLGGIYELGALIALDEALEGVDLHQLDAYVGVSSGAFIASELANQISTAQMARIFLNIEKDEDAFAPELFFKPAFKEYLSRASSVPKLLAAALWRYARNPRHADLVDELTSLSRSIPAGIFDNEAINTFLRDLYTRRGRSNDFRELKRKLFIVAAELDTGEMVKFGEPPHDHVPISKAVQASIALPGLYPPVEIDGVYYVDGALRRTLHASVALEHGVDLLFCINPIVPYNANENLANESAHPERLVDGGLPVVLAQTFRALIHSRLKVGLQKYISEYPDRDLVLFEPDYNDSKMFFVNVFSYANRNKVCQHAYRTTRKDLLARHNELQPIFARHNISVRLDVLEDPDREFDSDLQVDARERERARHKNRITNQLSNTLDALEEWMERT